MSRHVPSLARSDVTRDRSCRPGLVASGGRLTVTRRRSGGGDPRSSGEGPGLIGDPVFAVLAVLGLGLASVVVTYLYVRLTAGRPRP